MPRRPLSLPLLGLALGLSSLSLTAQTPPAPPPRAPGPPVGPRGMPMPPGPMMMRGPMGGMGGMGGMRDVGQFALVHRADLELSERQVTDLTALWTRHRTEADAQRRRADSLAMAGRPMRPLTTAADLATARAHRRAMAELMIATGDSRDAYLVAVHGVLTDAQRTKLAALRPAARREMGMRGGMRGMRDGSHGARDGHRRGAR
jgi:hypothetical protein